MTPTLPPRKRCHNCGCIYIGAYCRLCGSDEQADYYREIAWERRADQETVEYYKRLERR